MVLIVSGTAQVENDPIKNGHNINSLQMDTAFYSYWYKCIPGVLNLARKCSNRSVIVSVNVCLILVCRCVSSYIPASLFWVVTRSPFWSDIKIRTRSSNLKVMLNYTVAGIEKRSDWIIDTLKKQIQCKCFLQVKRCGVKHKWIICADADPGPSAKRT